MTCSLCAAMFEQCDFQMDVVVSSVSLAVRLSVPMHVEVKKRLLWTRSRTFLFETLTHYLLNEIRSAYK